MSSPDLICLLDDEPSVVRALGRLLAAEGWAAEKFTEPKRFLDHAATHPVRLAVIDMRMPGMSGLEVMAALRTIAPRAAVIIITAEEDQVHRQQAMGWGASAFFLKPLDVVAFIAAVRAALASPADLAR